MWILVWVEFLLALGEILICLEWVKKGSINLILAYALFMDSFMVCSKLERNSCLACEFIIFQKEDISLCLNYWEFHAYCYILLGSIQQHGMPWTFLGKWILVHALVIDNFMFTDFFIGINLARQKAEKELRSLPWLQECWTLLWRLPDKTPMSRLYTWISEVVRGWKGHS